MAKDFFGNPFRRRLVSLAMSAAPAPAPAAMDALGDAALQDTVADPGSLCLAHAAALEGLVRDGIFYRFTVGKAWTGRHHILDFWQPY